MGKHTENPVSVARMTGMPRCGLQDPPARSTRLRDGEMGSGSGAHDGNAGKTRDR